MSDGLSAKGRVGSTAARPSVAATRQHVKSAICPIFTKPPPEWPSESSRLIIAVRNDAATDQMTGEGDLALDRVERFLAEHVAGFRGPLAAERFAGGQSNPTYRLRAPSGDYVLRRKPSGPLLPSAHAVDREFRVMRALAATPVPAPRVYALCEDDGVTGSAFYVMEHLDGRILWDQRLPGIAPPG